MLMCIFIMFVSFFVGFFFFLVLFFFFFCAAKLVLLERLLKGEYLNLHLNIKEFLFF